MMESTIRIDPDQLDLARFIRPGDRVLCGQAGAEPLTLTQALVAQRHRIGAVQVFVGAMFSQTFLPEHQDVFRFQSYGALGTAAPLARNGGLSIVPIHYGDVPGAFASGRLAADVVLIQLADGGPGRPLSLGLANDYTVEAARRARLVIVELNRQMPWTHGAPWPDDIPIHACLQVDRAPLDVPSSPAGKVEAAIGALVAALVPDGATIETGIGSLPDAVLAALRGHRHLGLHTGMAGDRVGELIQAGVIDNSRKPIDTGVSVTNLLCGTRALRDLARDNPAISVRKQTYTHGVLPLAQLPCFFAINSSLEVDLTGQTNAEWLGGQWRGGVGGLNDFARAARRSDGGRSVIVLPSSAKAGEIPRIVPALSNGNVTVTRSDADLVVTEWGVADLRDCPLDERARRMIAVAAPQHREALEKSLRG